MDIKQVPHVVIETPGSKIKKTYEQTILRREDMFDCGIDIVKQIETDYGKQIDNAVLNAVLKVGINIDKPQLEKALYDAKSFYDDGYKDAKKEVIKKIYYAIKNEYCDVVGSCEKCKECFHPYICMTKVTLDEVLKLIENEKGEE